MKQQQTMRLRPLGLLVLLLSTVVSSGCAHRTAGVNVTLFRPPTKESPFRVGNITISHVTTSMEGRDVKIDDSLLDRSEVVALVEDEIERMVPRVVFRKNPLEPILTFELVRLEIKDKTNTTSHMIKREGSIKANMFLYRKTEDGEHKIQNVGFYSPALVYQTLDTRRAFLPLREKVARNLVRRVVEIWVSEYMPSTVQRFRPFKKGATPPVKKVQRMIDVGNCESAYGKLVEEYPVIRQITDAKLGDAVKCKLPCSLLYTAGLACECAGSDTSLGLKKRIEWSKKACILYGIASKIPCGGDDYIDTAAKELKSELRAVDALKQLEECWAGIESCK